MRDFALEAYFSRWEFNVRHLMSASDTESLSVAELLAMASDADQAAFHELRLGYTETWGAAELRGLIADTFDMLEPEDILCFAGAEEGIYTAMRVMLSSGDHAIVTVPNYQAAETVPLDQCEVSGVALDADDRWRLDIDAIARAIRPNTRLVSINFPNNPTGALLTRADLDALVTLCRRHGLYLFSDEVYRLMERDTAMRLPQVADVYERGLSLNVLSKSYGLPGLRIGWIGCRDRDLLQRFERYKHYLTICNAAPSERLAVIALKAGRQILARNRALIEANLQMLNRFFEDYQALFDWTVPDGGCIGFPKYLGAGGIGEFCRRLVDEEGVLLLPGGIYRSELLDAPVDRFRIGFGRAGLESGLTAFRRFLDRHAAELSPGKPVVGRQTATENRSGDSS